MTGWWSRRGRMSPTVGSTPRRSESSRRVKPMRFQCAHPPEHADERASEVDVEDLAEDRLVDEKVRGDPETRHDDQREVEVAPARRLVGL